MNLIKTSSIVQQCDQEKLRQKKHSLISPNEVDYKAYTKPFGLFINRFGKK